MRFNRPDSQKHFHRRQSREAYPPPGRENYMKRAQSRTRGGYDQKVEDAISCIVANTRHHGGYHNDGTGLLNDEDVQKRIRSTLDITQQSKIRYGGKKNVLFGIRYPLSEEGLPPMPDHIHKWGCFYVHTDSKYKPYKTRVILASWMRPCPTHCWVAANSSKIGCYA